MTRLHCWFCRSFTPRSFRRHFPSWRHGFGSKYGSGSWWWRLVWMNGFGSWFGALCPGRITTTTLRVGYHQDHHDHHNHDHQHLDVHQHVEVEVCFSESAFGHFFFHRPLCLLCSDKTFMHHLSLLIVDFSVQSYVIHVVRALGPSFLSPRPRQVL